MTQFLETSASARPTVADAVSTVTHSDGMTFLNAKTGRLFASNHVGARIWDALQHQMLPCEIAAAIACEYALPLPAAREHVDTFLTDLARHQLVETGVDR